MLIEELLNQFITGSTDNLLLVRILLFMLFFILIYIILDKSRFIEEKGINLLLGVIISTIATYYLSDTQIIQGILLPYKGLGLIISIAIPFLILLFISLQIKGSIIRKVLWGIFMLFLVYMYFRYPEHLIPLAAFAIISLLIIIFNKPINRYVLKRKIKKEAKKIK